MPKCKYGHGEMGQGKALLNLRVEAADFPGDRARVLEEHEKGSTGATISRLGPVREVFVWKCSTCGYSHT